MPKWGLTQAILAAKPWGFERDLKLLEPAKVVTDPVHGDIYLTQLELLVVNSRPLQRLRRVRQLGMTPMVYPGATNARFAHSLGAVRAAQDLLDVVLEQRHDPHGVPDLFGAWEAGDEAKFERKLGEVTVLARLGSLLHDLGHVPFGHSVEDDLGILRAHDANVPRFNHLWGELVEDLRRALDEEGRKAIQTLVEGELYRNLRPLILSKEKDENGDPIDAHEILEYPFVADIVGNTICADLIDYLPRDHLYSGLPMALGHRFMSAFFVTGPERTRLRERMALSIVRDERERTDVVTELLKHLRYRYELTERVLVHHAKNAGDAMVGKALELWFDELSARAASELAKENTTAEAMGEADDAQPAEDEIETSRRPPAKEAPASEPVSAPTLEELKDDPADTRAQKAMERRILAHGDDGLLEYLRDWTAGQLEGGEGDSERLRALQQLIDGLLRRDLFRLAGRSSSQQASAENIYRDYGGAERRRELEADAARFAGIDDDPWKLAIWLPPPEPRLKSAEVLVYDGSEIVEFHRSEQYSSKRGEDIYEAHKKLWAVSVYTHRSLDELTRRKALVRLAQLMEVRWDAEVEALGRRVLEWPDVMAARDVCERKNLGPREVELIEIASEKKAARGPEDVATYEALVATYEALAEALPSDPA